MEKIIYIVSGIPRSGTSMMMKMLEEGGLDVFYTTPNRGNEFNEDGYFETSYLRKLDVYHGWIDNVYGKGIKVFAQQLKNLPTEYYGKIYYKIIFMERDPVISAKSFARMQEKEMTKDESLIQEEYDKLKAEVASVVAERDNMEIIYVSYDDVLAHPQTKVQEIKDFTGVDFNLNKMVAVPDPIRKHF